MDARNLFSLTGFLLVLGAAGYYWGIAQRPPAVIASGEERHPDYVVQAISSLETDPEGRLLRRVTATELRHYDSPEEKAELDAPVMTFYERGQEAWQVIAPRATSLHQNAEVHLEGGVTAQRQDDTLPVTVQTASLTVFPHEERLITQDPVTVASPRGHIASHGLEARLSRGELKLTDNVTGTYAPAPR